MYGIFLEYVFKNIKMVTPFISLKNIKNDSKYLFFCLSCRFFSKVGYHFGNLYF